MLEDAINLHRAGRLDEAEQAYRQLLAGQPDNAGALHLLGILRGQRGDVAEALQLVTRASELDPDNAACRHTLGEMYLSEGRLDAAADAFEQARLLDPNLAAAHAGLGHVALLRGEREAAESHFKVALRADENDVQALTGLGNIAQARGDSARALRWFAQAAKQAPDEPRVQAGYAQALLDQDMLDFAAQAIDNALTVKPDFSRARALRAEVHVRKGELAAALPIFESLLARGEEVAPVRAGLGDIAQAQGRHDVAVAQYDEALRVQPDLHHAAIRRANALSSSGRATQAIDDLRGFVARHPDNINAQIELARLLARAGRTDEAIATCMAAEASWPDSVDVKAQHALTLERAGRFEEALVKAELAAASPRPAIAMLRARGALLAGDPAAAVQRLQRIDDKQFAGNALRRAQRRDRLLGLAYDRLEQWPEAVAAFMRAQPPEPRPLPELATLDDTAQASVSRLASGEALTTPRGRAPLFLCGLPGSGVEQVAAWLSAQDGVHVRRERFGAAPDFITGAFDPRLSQSLDQTTLAMLARRHQRALERARLPEGVQVVDWLPALDARVVPAIKLALPGARIVRVVRTAQDSLLDWLAFGWMPGFPIADPLAAARWLRLAHAHLDLAAMLLPMLAIDADALTVATDAITRQRLIEFIGLPAPSGSTAATAAASRDGLPTSFPPGHAVHYRECLSAAFAALDGMPSG